MQFNSLSDYAESSNYPLPQSQGFISQGDSGGHSGNSEDASSFSSVIKSWLLNSLMAESLEIDSGHEMRVTVIAQKTTSNEDPAVGLLGKLY